MVGSVVKEEGQGCNAPTSRGVKGEVEVGGVGWIVVDIVGKLVEE